MPLEICQVYGYSLENDAVLLTAATQMTESQDTAERDVAWQEWLFICSSTVSQEVLVYVNVLEKKN